MVIFSQHDPPLASFCTKRTDSTDTEGNCLITLTSGLTTPEGAFTSFEWVRVFKEKKEGGFCVTRLFGIAGDLDVEQRECGLYFSHEAEAVSEVPFCGRLSSDTHCTGGTGDTLRVSELPGFWQEGVLTHVVKEGKLVPVSPKDKS